MKKKGKPSTCIINGERHTATPMLVKEIDPKTGLPSLLMPMYPGQEIKVEEGMHFWIVFINSKMLKRSNN